MRAHRTPPRRARASRARATVRRLTAAGAAVAFLFLGACGDSTGPGGGGGGGGGTATATLSGTVRAAVGAALLENAQVTVGTRQVTSDASGHCELSDLPLGAATVRAERPGYLPEVATVTLGAGANTHDFSLSVQEIFVSGANAVYVPAGVGSLRGAIVILGGPITSGFVTGDRIAPVEKPELEVSLQQLGASFRNLARTSHVALLGTSAIAMASSTASDAALFNALRIVGNLSGHPELEAAPVLMVGFSAGSREAAGLVSRNPDRVIGLIERVPTGVTLLTAPAALAVPTFVMQAELDGIVDNAAVLATHSANRSAGGLWALAVEPGAVHDVATSTGNGAMTGWITMALALRLPATPGDPLIALDETSGWLGDQSTLEIASWAEYPGDRTTASWLLSQSAATTWQILGRGSD